ncbi:MAG: helix-hairpin-helix domain-containing protein, partial [archaeon]|nr:helix-hairpin-helix domain-containing protein [archaeon]
FHDTERLTSKLGNEKVLRGHILGLIATGDTSSEQEIKEFMEMTFYGATCSLLGIERVITSVVDFLSENGMVERAGDMVRILPFGKRVSDLYIDPWTAVILHKAVDKMDQDTDELMILHALACTPDVMGLYPKKTDLDMLQAVDMEYDGKYLCNIYDETGVDEDDEYGEDEKMSDIHLSDLKTAIMLRDWVNELSEDHITDYMKIGPGDIRSRVDNAEWILYSMNEVAYIFNPDATKYIKPLLTRLRYGVKDELIPLVSFRGIGRGRARILYDAGICNRQDLVDVDLLTLSKLPKIGNALAKSLKAQVGPSLEPDLPYAMSRQEEDEMDFMLEKMAAEMDPGGSASSEPVPEQAPAKGKAGPAVKKSKTRQVSLDMF